MSAIPSFKPADFLVAERELCARTLVDFVRQAWHVVEPETPFVHGWHLDAIGEHLEAVTAGQIRRLLINVPPGTMKSLLTGVFWPAWEWGPKRLASMRVLATSHSIPLAVRDNLKARRLITSEWFRTLWPHIELTSDQNAKTKFENSKTGFREAMAFTSLTGSRGDRVIIDDPHSVDGAKSKAERDSVIATFRESVPTRLNHPISSAIVVIMQRLHESDVSGTILDGGFGYEHLMLPMRYERAHKYPCKTSIGFTDPRTREGELLFPARFPLDVVNRDEKSLGEYATAGQMQQRPAPREGGMFKRDWFEIVGAAPARGRRVRAWDLAASDEVDNPDPDWTVGVRMVEKDGVFYIEDVRRERVKGAKVDTLIRGTAITDDKAVRVRAPQDPGAAGKLYAAYLLRLLAGWDVHCRVVTGSKEVRAAPLAAQAEAGNVKLVRGPWNEAFIDELANFPNVSHDDQVDAAADALAEILTMPAYSLENL